MVHVEKFKVKGNLYYKLVHNVRKEGKVKSISKYIGKVLPQEDKLQIMKDQFYQEVLQKRKQEKARKKTGNQNINSSLDDLPIGIIETKASSFELLYINKAAVNITGYDKLDFVKDTSLFSKIIYENDKDLVLQKINEKNKTKKIREVSCRILNKQGEIIWVNLSIDWRNNSKIFTLDNITQLKRSEQQFFQLFQYSPTPLIVLDYSVVKHFISKLKLRGDQLRRYFIENPEAITKCSKLVKVKLVNQSILLLFQAKDNESFIKIYKEKFARDSNQVFMEELISISDEKQEFDSAMNIFSVEGRRHRVQMTWIVPIEHKKTYSQVLVSIIDTTIQRNIAENMQIKNSAIENSKSAILITDLEGNITYANYAFIDLLNIEDIGQLIGSKAEIYLRAKEGGLKVLQTMHQNKSWQGIVELKQESKKKYLDVQGIFVTDEYHGALGMVFLYVDITEHKMTEKIRLDFTNIAAHELKTPLTPLRTFVSMMLDNPKQFGLNQDGIKNLQVCLRNVKKLSQLVGDILDISKLEAGGMSFRMEKSDLIKILQQEVEDFREAAKDKLVNIKMNLPKHLPHLVLDKARISQVIGNLIRNSLQYTEEGNILVAARLKEKEVQIKVVDTGLGIAKEDQEKLFTKFFQAADVRTRKVGGTGLGLAISKQIVEAHGGKMWASSQGKGKGSTFYISLPLNPKKLIK